MWHGEYGVLRGCGNWQKGKLQCPRVERIGSVAVCCSVLQCDVVCCSLLALGANSGTVCSDASNTNKSLSPTL